MRHSALAMAFAVVLASHVHAQATMQPINDGPNPYQTIEGWAKLPEGRTWGSTSAVDIDKDGKSIWVAERCGANSCANSNLPPVLKFDASGTLVKAFGEGMIVTPHGIFVDKDDNIWVVDCACTGGGGGVARCRGAVGGGAAGAARAGRAQGPPGLQVQPDGKLLMTLGKAGRRARHGVLLPAERRARGAERRHLRVRRAQSGPVATARVLKFSKDGTLIATWGSNGAGPDDFDQPHALAMDSKGRLFVGDRGNNRIKILDQDGKLLDTWYQFSRPSGIYIDKNDNIYVADSESGSVARDRTDWKRGIRIGSAKDGKVVAFIPRPKRAPRFVVDPLWPKPLPNHWLLGSATGVAVDSHDHIFVINNPNSFNQRTEVGAATTPPTGNCCFPAPPVLEFDQAGNLVGHWGGPGQGYDWPTSPSGIAIDDKDNVWIGGRGVMDGQVLEFTHDGKFLMQIGKPVGPATARPPAGRYRAMAAAGAPLRRLGAVPVVEAVAVGAGAGRWRNRRATVPAMESFGAPARFSFDAAANEVFVADGYRNRRIAVIDDASGKIKRYWGANGAKPDDAGHRRRMPGGCDPASKQFRSATCAAMSKDGVVTSAIAATTASSCSRRMARS